MPVLISGNVIPSSTDWGTMRDAAAVHFSALPTAGLPMPGKIEK